MKLLLTLLLIISGLSFGKTIKLDDTNSISFNQAFDIMYVAKKQVEAINLCASNVGKDIYVTLYTPGGSVTAGQLFFDTLNALPCKFHTITVFAASMGYQTVQNLGKRYIIPSGVLMSHRASISNLGGELGGELDSVLKLLNQNSKELDETASKRVGISLEKYRELIRDELWLTGNSAVESGHADELVNVSCDKSLMTTRSETINTFFGSFDAEFSNCPIIVGPISVSFADQETQQKVKNYYNNISKRIKLTL